MTNPIVPPRRFRPPFDVPDSLDDLQGPASGVLEVPHSIMWARSDYHTVDLSNDAAIVSAYREILGSATLEQLTRLVNKDHLVRLWPTTFDTTIRNAWEESFDELRNHVTHR
ncbi:hypothetical protein [Corynebacterium mayonis]|uniref:hypothetical protein n=1 Tax=Corynebacterium mayonis TaxID=3062461 RepID=UPI003140BD0D